MASTGTERPGTCPNDLSALSTAVDRLTRHATDWSTQRLLDEGIDLVRDACWADAGALLRVDVDGVEVLHTRPTVGSHRTPHPTPRRDAATSTTTPKLPLDWFPWGLAPVDADRFVLVDDARALTASPGDERPLGSLGVRSCLHLPLRQRGRTIGAIHVFWSEPRLGWDDDRGRLLRTLGRFLLECTDRTRT